MKSILALAVVFLVGTLEFATACGGGSNSLAGRGKSAGDFVTGSLVSPMSRAVAMQTAQINMARQAAAASAAAYSAQMRPVRLANASRVRAKKLPVAQLAPNSGLPN